MHAGVAVWLGMPGIDNAYNPISNFIGRGQRRTLALTAVT